MTQREELLARLAFLKEQYKSARTGLWNASQMGTGRGAAYCVGRSLRSCERLERQIDSVERQLLECPC